MTKDGATPIDPTQPTYECIPLSACARSTKLRISASPMRSMRPIKVTVQELDGTPWRVIAVTSNNLVRLYGDPPYPACPGNCWIDLDVECLHNHPPTETKPTELRGFVLCEPSDLPISAGDTERDRQWAQLFKLPHGASKLFKQ